MWFAWLSRFRIVMPKEPKMSLKLHLAQKFPGLVFPDKAAIRPGELIGYLSNLLTSDQDCRAAAEAHLPKKDDEH